MKQCITQNEMAYFLGLLGDRIEAIVTETQIVVVSETGASVWNLMGNVWCLT